MMEQVLIPVRCRYDIPSLNPMSMPSYKAGDIFMFNPYHEIHVELDEHNCFEEIDNDLCNFICQYPNVVLGKKQYKVGEKIADKDIKALKDEVIANLCYVGYIQKVLKSSSDNITKKPKAKKSTSETFATLARKLEVDNATFKKTIFDELGIEVKDMRKKVPLQTKKKILKLFNQ